MGITKFYFCTILAFSGTISFFYIFKHKKEKLAVIFTISAILLKILGVILIQIFLNLNINSDAAIYYLPQVNTLLKGGLPYIDFQTSYSILFPYFLAPFVMIWNSVGVIALIMVIIDSLTILFYLIHGYRRNDPLRWSIVFLYSINPISVYWSMTGYNGVMIQLVILISIILMAGDKPFLSGLISITGFLITKFLIVLFWPALVFYKKKNFLKRFLPYLLLAGLLFILWINGFDILAPLKLEFERNTSGNVWFLVNAVFPSLIDNKLMQLLSVLLFVIIFLLLFFKYLRINLENQDKSFDIILVFISITFLLFMILSRKSYPFYFQMSLLFLIHSVTRKKVIFKKGILSLMIIGAFTTAEPYLYQRQAAAGNNSIYFFLLLFLDSLLIALYVYLLILCYRTMLMYERKTAVLEEETTFSGMGQIYH